MAKKAATTFAATLTRTNCDAARGDDEMTVALSTLPTGPDCTLRPPSVIERSASAVMGCFLAVPLRALSSRRLSVPPTRDRWRRGT